MKFRTLTKWVLAVVVVSGLEASITVADSGSARYQYLLGSGVVCVIVGPTGCPDVSSAADGDTLVISGQGMLSIHPKTVTGMGTFVRKDPTGAIVASGIWTAEQLLSFRSYGNEPDLPSNFEGGLALILVHLSPDKGGPDSDAVLEVNCAIGKPPAGLSVEFVRLAVRGGPNFNKPVSGNTLYIRQP
jgi:hypothetical protein